MIDTLIAALFFQAGYNTSLVVVGATMLGIAAGGAGTFMFLRKRALVSDAAAHATLPGIGIAFIVMVALGGDGRNLAGLMIGSAVSAGIGLWLVNWINHKTRLSQDAAIGAILSIFFGLGVVLLTVIQSMASGRQAGLEGFLLGSTAGLLFQDAVLIAACGALAIAALLAFRRPMSIVAFDEDYASTIGIDVKRVDLAMTLLVVAVTVIGLRFVGLILIVAMLIVPSVAARFWSDRTESVLLLSAVFGGISAYFGTAVSASAPDLPTGPIIVLVSFFLFLVSLLMSPKHGVLAALLQRRDFQHRVHERQGLLQIAHDERIHDPLTLRVLSRAGLVRDDHVPTESGRQLAAKARLDEQRWAIVRKIYSDDHIAGRYDGLTAIEDVLTRDEIVEIDRHLPQPSTIGADT